MQNKLKKDSKSSIKANSEQQDILADKTDFILSEEEFSALQKALNEPIKNISVLKRLLSKPSIFDAK